MVEKPYYVAFINPVPGLDEAKQREMLAPFKPKEFYVVGQLDHDTFARQIRPPKVALVCFTGLLAIPEGKKQDRVESMLWTKSEIHKRGGYVVDAQGRDSRKDWSKMRPGGEDMCRRLALGAKSAMNAKTGSRRLSDRWSDTDVREMLRIKESRKYSNWLERKAAMKKAGVSPIPGRTVFIEKLEHIARDRGILK